VKTIKAVERLEHTTLRLGGHGDNWHMTWADDGKQYVSLCDGNGLPGTPDERYHNSRAYAISGDPPAVTFEYLPGYPDLIGLDDTIRDEPDVQEVMRDGVALSFEPYDTAEIPLSFDKEIHQRCTRQGASYRAEVETTFRRDSIICTYRAERTGPSKSGSVVLSIPARRHVHIACLGKDGVQTEVWDGETVTPAGNPLEAHCIHMHWPEWKVGLALEIQGGEVGKGALVTALDYTPYASPRQLDQDRSLLIYLAKDEVVESVSITFVITPGSSPVPGPVPLPPAR